MRLSYGEVMQFFHIKAWEQVIRGFTKAGKKDQEGDFKGKTGEILGKTTETEFVS